MKHSLLPYLISPEDGTALTLAVTDEKNGEVETGTLTDGAGRVFPIENGIPRLLPAAMLDAQKSEMKARDEQVDAYDSMTLFNLFGHVEIPLVLHALQPRPDDILLEGGCGTGRMTQPFAAATREVIAMDFSWESLRVNQKKLENAGVKNVHLMQADLCRLPFPEGKFSRVASCGVLEHVPTPASRQKAVAELARVAAPSALLALSAYKHSLWTRAFDKKEGAHDGGIPFVRFTEDELHALLSTSLAVHSLTGVLVYYYLARCTKK